MRLRGFVASHLALAASQNRYPERGASIRPLRTSVPWMRYSQRHIYRLAHEERRYGISLRRKILSAGWTCSNEPLVLTMHQNGKAGPS